MKSLLTAAAIAATAVAITPAAAQAPTGRVTHQYPRSANALDTSAPAYTVAPSQPDIGKAPKPDVGVNANGSGNGQGNVPTGTYKPTSSDGR